MVKIRMVGILLFMSLLSVVLLTSTACAEGELIVNRSVNTSDILPGDTVQVTVSITGGSEKVDAPAIQEFIPAGWTLYFDENENYPWNSVWTYSEANTTFLGPTNGLASGNPAEIIYYLTANSYAGTGAYSISGNASGIIGASATEDGTRFEFEIGATDINVTGGLEPGIHLYDGDNLAAAYANASAGDTIYLHAGNYSLENWFTMSTPQVSIIGDSPDDVTIEGQGVTVKTYGMTFENLTFGSIAGATSSDAVAFSDTYVNNCVVGSLGMGLMLGPNSTVENCNISDRIYIYGGDGIIRNNVATCFESTTLTGYSSLIENNVFTSGDTKAYAQGGASVIFQNNIFEDGTGINARGNATIRGNTFIGAPDETGKVQVSTSSSYPDNPLIYENTFDSCPVGIAFKRTAVAVIYLNEFIDVDTVASWYSSEDPAVSTWQSAAMDYTINGVTINGPLGNYYSNYTGVDDNGDGIGDTPVNHSDFGIDSYPLMAQMEDGGLATVQTLAEMTVDQIAGETYEFTPYDNPDEEYTIDSMTDFGVLIASGLDFKVSDRWEGFFLDSLEGYTNEDYSETEEYYSWHLCINDVSATTGLGSNMLDDTDKVSFYYAPHSGTTPDISRSLYVVHLTASEDAYPVIAQRDIKNQNFYEELLNNYDLTSTKVTVTLTAREGIDSLTFEEVIPAGWTITPSEDDEAVFKQNLNETNRYEWVWTDKMDSGESKTVVYTLTLPKTAAGGDYPVEGTCSAYVGDEDHDDIPVVGDNNVNVSDTDWNPWNDVDSDGGAYITTDELQSAINCWLEDLTVPGFSDEYVTTDRLQMLVHYWVQNAECPEGADV
jgi:hypothetical protein